MRNELFATPAFRSLCQRILVSVSHDNAAPGHTAFEGIKVLVVLTHESFYDDPLNCLRATIMQVREYFQDSEIAIKAHPRSTHSEQYTRHYPNIKQIPNQIGTEVLAPMLDDQCIVIGDVSSTLFTTRWLKPGAQIVAVELASMARNRKLHNNLIKLFSRLNIPMIEQSDIAGQIGSTSGHS